MGNGQWLMVNSLLCTCQQHFKRSISGKLRQAMMMKVFLPPMTSEKSLL